MSEARKSPKRLGPESSLEASRSTRPRSLTAELYAIGKSLREKCSRSAHAVWQAPPARPDPFLLLKESSKGRIPDLIPIRYGRMLKSPFTFYRGAALNMAADLAGTPTTGLRVQACGDCHLCNFGMFATPERRVIFDINDLDETLPAPWEWDVKRLAASFVLASRHNGFGDGDARDTALACVRSYRQRMAEFSQMRVLDIWYASIDVEKLVAALEDRDTRKTIEKRLGKARARGVLEHHFPELEMKNGGTPTIKDHPPLVFHPSEQAIEQFSPLVQRAFSAYRETLPEHRRSLFDRFKLADSAIKVVGVGSVGTVCAVALLMAGDNDPLFLQVKQAGPSVLERFAGKSTYSNHGQRVVVGSQLMQFASDVFLGWTEGLAGIHFYVRQLRDMKIKPMVEAFTPSLMLRYAEVCGWSLARAHARSGEPAKISGYLGNSDKFDQAVADFSIAYANQIERDYEVLKKAVKEGKLEVALEPEHGKGIGHE